MKQKRIYTYILLLIGIGYFLYFRVQPSRELITLKDKIDNYEYLIQYKSDNKEYLKPEINGIINRLNIGLNKNFK